jgi:ribosomal protein L21
VYAIIRDRGMQYRVEKGQVLNIDLRDGVEARQPD